METLDYKRLKYLEKNCYFSYIINDYCSQEFNEYVVSVGGDVVTYRIYGTDESNFRITVK